jgi:hypothetical protein
MMMMMMMIVEVCEGARKMTMTDDIATVRYIGYDVNKQISVAILLGQTRVL